MACCCNMTGKTNENGRSTRLSKTIRLSLAHGAMIFVVIAFSVWNVLGSVITTKYCSSGDINCPIVFAFYREVGASVILCIGCGINRSYMCIRNIHDGLLLLGTGLSLFGIQLLYILGLDWTNADTVAFYQPANPVTVVLLAFILGMEKYGCNLQSLLKVSGILVTIGGVVLIVLDGESVCQDWKNASKICSEMSSNASRCNSSIEIHTEGHVELVNGSTACCRSCEGATTHNANYLMGNIILMLMVVSSALFTIFQKKMLQPRSLYQKNSVSTAPNHVESGTVSASKMGNQKSGIRTDTTTVTNTNDELTYQYSAMMVITYSYGIAAFLMVVLMACLRPPLSMFAIQPEEIGVVLYAVIICSVVCYVLMTYALTEISATVSSLYGSLQPPITAAVAWFMIDESVSLLLVGGGVLATIGLIMTSAAEEERIMARACTKKGMSETQRTSRKESSSLHQLSDPLIDNGEIAE